MVPEQAVLKSASRHAVRQATVQRAIDEVLSGVSQQAAIEIPADLAEQVRAAITGTTLSWDYTS